MNATAAKKKRNIEEIANIVKVSVNVSVPQALPYLSLKLKPARVALESLPQD